MARNKSSFGESVAKGLDTTYSAPKPVSNKKAEFSNADTAPGVNPYYQYHGRKGAHGGQLGAPRKSERRVSMSFSCLEAEKTRIQKAAAAENKTLAAFILSAVLDYINRNFDF